MANEACAAGKQASHVEAELGRLSNATERLDNLVGRLGNRLCAVIMPMPVAGEAIPCAPRPTLVPLADSIRTDRERVEDSCERLLSLLNNMEL